jgi:predicted nuclease of predicted toxin-antitoxin system
LIFWVDAQLSPHLAPWLHQQFGLEACSVARLSLRNAKDLEIFQAARAASAVVLTKDQDFVFLLETLGPPPQILWVSCGNTSNAHLKKLLAETLPQALDLLARGEALIEIRDAVRRDGAGPGFR